jgi:hypothetical protein
MHLSELNITKIVKGTGEDRDIPKTGSTAREFNLGQVSTLSKGRKCFLFKNLHAPGKPLVEKFTILRK